MTFEEISNRAMKIREKYKQLETKEIGRPWTRQEVLQGFFGDIGQLAKLLTAKEGLRKDINHIDERVAHEFADCLYCLLVLAKEYDIDLEQSFQQTMKDLDDRISTELNQLNK
jgi:NTP pyrophosphatase (non-canonical NTP hydrolase)